MKRALLYWTVVAIVCAGYGMSLGAADRASAKTGTGTADGAEPVPIFTKDSAPPAPKLDELPLQGSVSKNGITWTFDAPARVGRFINGDVYVVGPVTVKAIDPKPLWGDEIKTPLMEQGDTKESLFKGQTARNGSTLNMPAVVPPSKLNRRTSLAGFDSRLPMGQYDPGQFTKLPIAMKGGDSLVSSISTEPLTYGGYPVKALAVLTCVDAPPPADAFRPSFVQTKSCPAYLARDLHRELLLKLPKPASAEKLRPAQFAPLFSDLWVDTVGFGRAMPRQAFPFNGAGIADVGGGASLMLLLDYTPQEKEPLLVSVLQVGIDLCGIVRGGGGWPAEGICGSGRKWIITFAGLVLGDANMSAVSKTFPDAEFQEDEQTAFLPMEYNGRKFEKTHNGAKVFWTGHYGYRHGQWPPNKWASGWGATDLYPPSEWPSPWPRAESDRRQTSSPHWVGEALAARLMHAEKVWGHDAFFAYVDRWMTEDDSKAVEEIKKNWDDKLAAATTDEAKKAAQADQRAKWLVVHQGTVESHGELTPVVKELWAKYRNDLPPAPDGAKTPPAETTWK